MLAKGHVAKLDKVTTAMKFALSSTGGLRYHLIALSRQGTHWQSFRRRIADWLAKWNPQEPTLIIFGASGGYTLPLEFLKRFEKIVVVEPDPIAKLIFIRRFRGIKNIAWIHDPKILPWFAASPGDGTALVKLLKRHQPSAVLFANLLGQVPLLTKDLSSAQVSAARNTLKSALKKVNWASYHDLYSSRDSSIVEWMTNSAIDGNQLSRIKDTLIIDHDTQWITDGVMRAPAPKDNQSNKQTEFIYWPIHRQAHHIIGFYFETPSSAL